MKVITKIGDMREYSRSMKKEGKTIGFVPTMGYLHDGHLSLARAAKKENDAVVISIYVNPTQFGPGEDFDKYPRDLERDKSLADKEGVDVIFAPVSGEMYPVGYVTDVEVKGHLTEALCGRARPGHFRGVTTFVAKLFNIVGPDRAYFGRKDAQQAAVIKRMACDLSMPLDIRVMPIVREDDGLAMSSRNAYLSKEERHRALALYRSLERAKEMISAGELSAGTIKNGMKSILEKDVRLDYLEVVDADTLQPLDKVRDNTLIAVAAFAGGTRLIDNVVIEKVTSDG
jgi:pantoate--beta-alanine ligase